MSPVMIVRTNQSTAILLFLYILYKLYKLHSSLQCKSQSSEKKEITIIIICFSNSSGTGPATPIVIRNLTVILLSCAASCVQDNKTHFVAPTRAVRRGVPSLKDVIDSRSETQTAATDQFNPGRTFSCQRDPRQQPAERDHGGGGHSR